MAGPQEELEGIRNEIALLEHTLSTLEDAAALDGVIDDDEAEAIAEMKQVIRDVKSERDALEAKIAAADAAPSSASPQEASADDSGDEIVILDEDEEEVQMSTEEGAGFFVTAGEALDDILDEAEDVVDEHLDPLADAAEPAMDAASDAAKGLAEAMQEAAGSVGEFFESDAAAPAPPPEAVREEEQTIAAALAELFAGPEDEEDEPGEYVPAKSGGFHSLFYDALDDWARDMNIAINAAMGYFEADTKAEGLKASDITGIAAAVFKNDKRLEALDTGVKILELHHKVLAQQLKGGSEAQTLNAVHHAMSKTYDELGRTFRSLDENDIPFTLFPAEFVGKTGKGYFDPAADDWMVDSKAFEKACKSIADKYMPTKDAAQKRLLSQVLASLPDSVISLTDHQQDGASGFDAGYAYVEITWYPFLEKIGLRSMTINDAGPEAANAIKTLYAGKTIVDVPVKIAIIARGVMDGRNPMNPTDMLGMSPTVPIATIRRKSTREGSLDFEGHEELLDQFRENNFFAELKVSELS